MPFIRLETLSEPWSAKIRRGVCRQHVACKSVWRRETCSREAKRFFRPPSELRTAAARFRSPRRMYQRVACPYCSRFDLIRPFKVFARSQTVAFAADVFAIVRKAFFKLIWTLGYRAVVIRVTIEEAVFCGTKICFTIRWSDFRLVHPWFTGISSNRLTRRIVRETTAMAVFRTSTVLASRFTTVKNLIFQDAMATVETSKANFNWRAKANRPRVIIFAALMLGECGKRINWCRRL